MAKYVMKLYTIMPLLLSEYVFKNYPKVRELIKDSIQFLADNVSSANASVDIDILIISSDNKKIEQKVKDEIFNILLSKDQLISAHVISEKKFNETKNFSFLSNVLSEGVPIG